MRLSSLLTANNPFPSTIAYVAVVQDEDSFYIVGGRERSPGSNGRDMDTIYLYEATIERWQLMPNRMKHRRRSTTAMMVKRSIFPKCD